MSKSGRRSSPVRVCILGESPLVEEYVAACLGAGMNVSFRFNPGQPPASAKLPKGARKSARPAQSSTFAIELTNTSRDLKKKNLAELDNTLKPEAPILTSSVAITVADQAGWIQRPSRLVGVSAMPSFLQGGLVELAPSAGAEETVVGLTRQFFKAMGKQTSIVQDSPGMVMPRILSMLVNEAFFALGEGIAAQNDIDTAMKLGTNYPLGPLEWAERIGIAHVHAVVAGLYRDLGEERYRIAPLLQRAIAGAAPLR